MFQPGSYITIHVSNVSLNQWKQWKSLQGVHPTLIVYGLLPHETQMSVMNVVLKRSPDSTIPLKSKERLIVQCGYRRFIVNPVYSQHTNSDRHKVNIPHNLCLLALDGQTNQYDSISLIILSFVLSSLHFHFRSTNDSFVLVKQLWLAFMHQFNFHRRQFSASKRIPIPHFDWLQMV